MDAHTDPRKGCINKRPIWLATLIWALLPGFLQAQIETLDEAWRWVHFTTDSGLPANEVYDVVVTSSGTVWLSTSKGLAWYDGFYWQARGETAGLPEKCPTTMVADGQGRLLVIVEKQLYQGDERGFHRIPAGKDSIGLKIQSAVPFVDGGILILSGCSFYLYQSGVLKAFAFPTDISIGKEPRLWKVWGGGIWLKAASGLYRREEDRWVEVLPDVIPNRLIEGGNRTALIEITRPDKARGLWEWEREKVPRHSRTERMDLTVSMDIGPENEAVVVYESGDIRIRRDGIWSSLEPVPPPMRNALCVKFRDNGDLWVGTEEGLFLYRKSSKRWTYWRYGALDMRNRVHDILRTQDGSIWLATGNGVEIRRTDGTVEWIERIQDIRLNAVTGLMEDEEGGVWVSSGASFAGVYRWDGSEWHHFGAEQGLEAPRVHRIRKDRQGRLWFLGMAGISGEEPGAFVFDDGEFTRWGPEEGLIHGRVYAFAEGLDGTLWFGTKGGLSRWKGGEWTHWTTDRGLKENRIFTLAVDPENRLWFGDQQNGLGCIDADDQLGYLTTADGLVHDQVWDLRVDVRGTLWIATQSGLGSYRDGLWSGFRTGSGLSHQRLWPVLPLAERVYVGTRGKGVCVLNLEEVSDPPPQIVLEEPVIEEDSVLLRWHAFAWWGQLPQSEGETRYRLDGQPWSVWSTRREIVLKDFSPGSHTFQVQAKGLFGNWDPDGQSVSFEISLPLYLRPIFFLSMGLLLIALIVQSIGFAVRRRKHAEERHYLLTSARCLLWHALVEEREGIYQWDIRIKNEEAAQQFLPLEVLPDQAYADAWYQSKLPEDRQRMDEISSTAFRERKSSYNQEFRCRQADGTLRWLSEDVRIRPLGARRWQLAGVCIDITERKQAEETIRINLALQQVRNEILQMEREEDWQKVVLIFHKKLKELVACNACSINLVDSQTDSMKAYAVGPRKGLQQNFRDQVPHPVRKAMETGTYVYRRNRKEALFADNVPLPPEVNSVIDVPFAGGTVAINSMEEDAFSEGDIQILQPFANVISAAHRRLEDLKALALREQHLRQTQRLKMIDQLATGVAHEINNPLTLVIGFARLLLKHKLAPGIRERVEAIHEGGTRVAAIVERLLRFSRVQKGYKQLLDLNVVVCETLALVRYPFETEHVQLIEKLEENLPPVEAHPGQIQQVILNLVQNSRDAILSGRQPGTVKVRTRTRGDWVMLEVADDGPGIPEEIQERIFEPFFTTQDVGEGTGLGLSVCHGMVQDHGGHLRVEPQEKGACLLLELPAATGQQIRVGGMSARDNEGGRC